MTIVSQNFLSTIMLKNVELSYERTEFTWQHQKYARPELYVIILVIVEIFNLKFITKKSRIQDSRFQDFKTQESQFKKEFLKILISKLQSAKIAEINISR